MSEEKSFFDGYSLQDIHDWYMSLAVGISKYSGSQSTAPKLLQYYLTPAEQKCDIQIINFCHEKIGFAHDSDGKPNHFGNDPTGNNGGVNKKAGTYEIDDIYLNKIKKYTEYSSVMDNMLNIFLSKKNKNIGIIKRIKNKGVSIGQEYNLYYYTTCSLSGDTKSSLLLKAKFLNENTKLSKEDQDLYDIFVGLNTFIIRADVKLVVEGIIPINPNAAQASNKSGIEKVLVSIVEWENKICDYYDFNQKRGFSLPNPHYPNGKIHPDKKNVMFNEASHEKLVEMTKVKPQLANPFYVFKKFYETNSNYLVKNYEVKYEN